MSKAGKEDLGLSTDIVGMAKQSSAYPSVAALARDLGLCERSTRDALRLNKIPHIRIGRRYILPRTAIEEWLKTAGRTGGQFQV